MEVEKKKILYLSYDGMTDSLGQSQVLPYIIGLSQHFKFSLISFEKQDRFLLYKDKIQAICDANNIDWYPMSYTKRPPVLSTLYDLRRMYKLVHKLDKINDFELLHCRSYIPSLVALRFKNRYQKKFIFDMRGFWADEQVDGQMWNLKNPLFKIIYNYFKRKEKLFFEKSDAIVSLTQNGKSEILTWGLKNVTDEKISMIPCCVNLQLFDPKKITEIEKKELRSELNIHEDDFVLGYIGSIGTWYMLDEMLDFFRLVHKKQPKSKFLFVTGNPPEDIFSKAVEKGIEKESIVITKCFHEDVPKYVSIFNQSIFFIKSVYSKKASSPTKQGELMAMGIPVICNAGIGDSDLIITNYNSGILVNSFTEEEYAKSFDLSQTKLLSEANIREGAQQFYSLEEGVTRYLKIYSKLIGK